MSITVVNIKKGKVPYDVYGGRPWGGVSPTRKRVGENGWLGNPYTVNPDEGDTRDIVIAKYRAYFWARVNNEPVFREAVLALKGKTVACFCKPKACHLDVVDSFLQWSDTPEGIEWLKEVSS